MSSVAFSISGNAALSKLSVRNLACSSTTKASRIKLSIPHNKHQISAPPKQAVLLRLNRTRASTTPNLGRREAIGLGFLAGLGLADLSLHREPSAAAEAAATPCELTVVPSGLAFCDKVVGTGPEAVKGQLIKAHYVGKLENGKVFDSSYNRGKPLTFRVGVGEVIKGWDEGILGGEGVPPMQAGGKRTLKLPPELGYGMRGAGCRGGSCIIPPDSVLLFDVELLK